jgi:hypothetical protein
MTQNPVTDYAQSAQTTMQRRASGAGVKVGHVAIERSLANGDEAPRPLVVSARGRRHSGTQKRQGCV